MPPAVEPPATPLTIFGGTFDPIHLGHLHAIAQIRRQVDVGEILVVPAGAPWQKSDRSLAPALGRLEMCRLAFAGDPGVTVSDLEIRREGPTFTIDTVLELRRQALAAGLDRQINLIVGADSVRNLHTWHRYEDLIKSVHIIVCARPEYPVLADQLPEAGFTLVEVSALAISSSLVRERIGLDLDVTDLVPDAVWRYISSHGLYGAGAT